MKELIKSGIVTIGIVGFISACGSMLSSSDVANKAVLSDVATRLAVDSTATGTITDGTPTPTTTPAAGSCAGNPLLDACLADAKTYCASDLPRNPDAGAATAVGKKSFEDHHGKMRKLLACLQTNQSSLSATCQTALTQVPTEPGCHRGGPGPGGDRHGPGHGRPEGCHGQSRLAACIGDAKTLCSADLPTPGEVDNLTPDERKLRVDAIVSCLNAATTSVSADCQTALAKWTTDRANDGNDGTASTSSSNY